MDKHRFLTAERKGRILQLLKKKRAVSVADLCKDLEVSEATIRRDLAQLEEANELERVHGGATLLNDPDRKEPIFSDKQGRQTDEKLQIAQTALKLINDHETIYLDGGSTLLELARLLDQRSDLTIVTNSLMAAAELMESNHRLILIGGEFRALSRTLIGPLTSHLLHSLNVDKAFMGTIGYTPESGMTTTDVGEAFTKTEIMSRAKQTILLADHTKIGVRSTVCSKGEIDILVCDEIPAETLNILREKDIKVIFSAKTKTKNKKQ